MHVLVATDGHLDAERTTPLVTALAGDGGAVTVLTIVEVPRRFLSEMRAARTETSVVSLDHEDVSLVATTPERNSWPGDDAVIQRYLDDKRDARCGPLADALRAAGVEPDVIAREGENVARDIIDVAGEVGADVLVIGSRGSGFFDGLLGSTGTKLTRLAPCPLLLIRTT